MRWLVTLVCAGCSFEPGRYAARDGGPDDDAPARPDPDGGTPMPDAMLGAPDAFQSPLREKRITINNGVTGTHANFPLWVTLTDPDIAARARADGQDIHFVDAEGADLAYEIQAWTPATGKLEAWVRVPSLAAGTVIAVRYGELAAAHVPSSATVFAAYLAVWHLEDTLTSNTIVEAKNMVPGTASGLEADDHVTGQLGYAIDFDAGNDQIAFTNPLTGSGAHTISLWVNQRTTTTDDAMVVLGNGSYNKARWFHSRYTSSGSIAAGFYSNDFTDVDENIQNDGWTLLHWVFEGANRMSRIYRDGVQIETHTHATGIDTEGTGGFLGNAQSAFGQNMGLAGALDEVRIIGTARSANWIAAEAANQKTPATFYTVGAELTP